MQRWFKIFAVVTAVGLVLFAGAFAFMRQPSLFTWRYELKIATGPIGSDGQKILAAFIREVAAERPIVRLIPVPTESLSASGKALIDGQVDLAVVRSDDEAAAQGRTVFILRRPADSLNHRCPHLGIAPKSLSSDHALERSQFQCIQSVISQLRTTIAKRLIDLTGPGGNRPRGGAARLRAVTDKQL